MQRSLLLFCAFLIFVVWGALKETFFKPRFSDWAAKYMFFILSNKNEISILNLTAVFITSVHSPGSVCHLLQFPK